MLSPEGGQWKDSKRCQEAFLVILSSSGHIKNSVISGAGAGGVV